MNKPKIRDSHYYLNDWEPVGVGKSIPQTIKQLMKEVFLSVRRRDRAANTASIRDCKHVTGGKRSFLQELKENIQDAGQRPINALDKVIFLLCMVGGLVLAALVRV